MSEVCPKCPQCGSVEIPYKDGLRYLPDGQTTQRWLCRGCGYRFSAVQVGNKANKAGKRHYNIQLCVLEAKKLDSATETKTVAGENQKDTNGKLVWFLWEMQKQNYSRDTISTYSRAIRALIRRADLSNPESVKEALAKWGCGESHKHNIAAAYTLFLGLQGQTWKPPLCHVNRKLPFIPAEKELDALIAGTGRKTSAFLQTLKETAMRSGECARLKWENVDLQRRTIILNETEKNGNPRIFSISETLANIISKLPKKTMYVFGATSKTARSAAYYSERKRLSSKLENPRILKIGLHTFRHWKATMLYHETHDIILVKEFLGHKTLNVTLLYVQIEKALFKNEAENFIVKATKEPEEIQALLEVGFEFVCQKDSLMFFRKRK
jgi:integrase